MKLLIIGNLLLPPSVPALTLSLLRSDKERALGFPRADSFLPVGHREEGPDARVTRDEVASIALERATTMLAAAASHTMDTLAVEMLQRLHIQIVEESCEVAGKPSEVLAHQLNLKHNISQYIADALEELENMVVSQVAGAMSDDDSEFKLGRFPQFINAMSKIFIRQLAPWKDKTDAALMSYVNVAFQSPLSNPHFKLKYTFLNDGDGLYPHCEMDFDAEALAATIVHTIVLRCSILLTETVGIEADIKALLHSVDFTESCAAERNIYLKGLYHVEKVVNQLKAHLELDEEDIDHFRRTGSILVTFVSSSLLHLTPFAPPCSSRSLWTRLKLSAMLCPMPTPLSTDRVDSEDNKAGLQVLHLPMLVAVLLVVALEPKLVLLDLVVVPLLDLLLLPTPLLLPMDVLLEDPTPLLLLLLTARPSLLFPPVAVALLSSPATVLSLNQRSHPI
jgi:hypothetical protein